MFGCVNMRYQRAHAKLWYKDGSSVHGVEPSSLTNMLSGMREVLQLSILALPKTPKKYLWWEKRCHGCHERQ